MPASMLARTPPRKRSPMTHEVRSTYACAPVASTAGMRCAIAIACHLGATRLIDNADLKSKTIVVVNCVPTGKAEQATFEEAKAVAAKCGLTLCQRYVCHRRQFVTSTNAGKGVTEISGAKPAADEIRGLWLELNKLSPIAARNSEAVR